jgi:hypothetical protein
MVSKGATHIISFNILFQNERHTNYINVSQTKDILKSLNKGNIAMKQSNHFYMDNFFQTWTL